MEAFAGEPTWVSHQIERFRFGDPIYKTPLSR
jgi:hypothetical protein